MAINSSKLVNDRELNKAAASAYNLPAGTTLIPSQSATGKYDSNQGPALPKGYNLPAGMTLIPSQGATGKYDSNQGPALQNPNGISASSSNPMTKNKTTGIRSTMVNAGLKDNLIDWNSKTGMVTYNGKDIMAPESVIDGVSYGNEDYINQAIQGILNEQGYTGVRNTLVNRNIDNSKIGWNDATKSITYNGKDIYKPTNIIDGKSYASIHDINNLTNEIYRLNGNELAKATDYAANSGLRQIVQWSADGKCTVGGIEVPVVYVDSGDQAWVKKSDLDSALSRYMNEAGIVGDKGVYDNWNGKYNKKTQSALNKVLNREDWDYDPYEDPAYLSYRDQYEREGNRAYQDAYAAMAGGTGGYGNSAAVTAGAQQLGYYMQQLNDKVPELQQNSWNRYTDEQEMNRQALDAIRNVGNDDYNKLYTANSDAYDRVNQAAQDAYDRRNYEQYEAPINREDIKQAQETTKQMIEGTSQSQESTKQSQITTSDMEIENRYRETLKQQEVDRGGIEIEQLIENLDFSKYINAFDKAYERGWFNDSEAAIIGYTKNIEKYPDSNGYPNPKEGAAISDLYYWKHYGKIEFDDQQDKIIEGEIKKINAQAAADIRVAYAKAGL